MRRVIVDYKKLTPEILELLSEKFPDGYNDDDIIVFDNHKNETIEAVEVKTDDCIYLVRVSRKLHYTMTNFENSADLELDDAGHVIVNDDFNNEVINEEEE